MLYFLIGKLWIFHFMLYFNDIFKIYKYPIVLTFSCVLVFVYKISEIRDETAFKIQIWAKVSKQLAAEDSKRVILNENDSSISNRNIMKNVTMS